MSTLVEEYTQRYINRYHDKIKAVCEPLRSCFGINYFTYHSINEDGLWRPWTPIATSLVSRTAAKVLALK